MEALVVFVGLAVLAVLIWLWYKVSVEFYSIAVKKGYDEKKYLWWTFFFGIAGMLMVVALPEVKAAVQKQQTEIADELPDL